MSADLDRLIEEALAAPWPDAARLAPLRAAAQQATARLVDRLEREPAASRRRRLCELLADVVGSDPRMLAPHLATPSWYLARNLARVLGELRTPEAVPYLAALARHPEVRVRREVIDALARIGGPAAREARLVFFEDPEPRVRRHCIESLDAAYDARAASRLLEIVRSDDFSPEGTSLKEAAVAALARMRADEARPVLERVARSRWTFGRGRRVLQAAARGALAQAYAPRAYSSR